MAKSDDTKPTPKRISPVQIASEAISAVPGKSDEGLPPAISLEAMTPDRIVDAAHKAVIDQAFAQLQKNVVNGALAQSESFLLEEQKKRDAARSQLPGPVTGVNQTPAPGRGLLDPLMSTNPSAVVDAVLKNLESDEAKIKFINEHPELLNPSPAPFPGMVASRPSSPVGSETGAGMIQSVMDMIKVGVELQKSATPQQQPYQPPSQQVDVVTVVNTFKEINEKTTAAFSELFKNVQDQNKAAQDAAQKAVTESQSQIIKLQMELVTKDKEYSARENEQLRDRMAQLEEALRAPPQVPLNQLKSMFEQAKAGGVPVSMVTPEQEKVQAEIRRADKRLEHELSKESRQLEIELAKESRRASAISSLGGLLGGVFETQLIKKHSLSPAGANVDARF